MAFERGHHVSYSACGIPYLVAGDVDTADALIARSTGEHRANGIDLRLRIEVTEIDLSARTVTAAPLDGGASYQLGFDELVLATGAAPVRPELPGVNAPGVFGVQTLDDGTAVLAALSRLPRRAVVGGGYIGIEMAEAMVRRGLAVTMVDRAVEPMATLDPDMGALVREAMEGLGITVLTGSPVTGFETGPGGGVSAVITEKGTLPADLVVLGLGVRPATDLALAAGLPLGEHGGALTDRRMRVPGRDGLWAGGDCAPGGLGKAGRRVRRGAVERDDRRGDDRPGPRLRATVLSGVGSSADGCPQGGSGSLTPLPQTSTCGATDRP
ncbi:MAG: NAD(P)/FAD-dependent oxidoreductase [Pseudonocardiaceae bacterium]